LRQALIEAAKAANKKKGSAFGARYRRLTRHLGPKKAIVAVARQILEIAYHLLGRHTTYLELGVDYYSRRYSERVTRRCVRQLEHLGSGVTFTPLSNAA
jgi:hypothetical protein